MTDAEVIASIIAVSDRLQQLSQRVGLPSVVLSEVASLRTDLLQVADLVGQESIDHGGRVATVVHRPTRRPRDQEAR